VRAENSACIILPLFTHLAAGAAILRVVMQAPARRHHQKIMLNQSLTSLVSRNDTVNRLFCQCAGSKPARGRAAFVNQQKRFEMEAFTSGLHLDSKDPSTVVFYCLATKLNGNPGPGRD
jgi:hypothetical protein